MFAKSILSLLGAAILCTPVLAQDQYRLPEGKGKETIQAACIQCHPVRDTVIAGFSLEGWTDMVHMMVNLGAPLPDDQMAVALDYLTKNFPEKPKPAPVVISGSVQTSFQDWVLPTLGSRPQDALVAPDGQVWYTAQMAGVLGRIDPKTGEIKEYHPKTPRSGPKDIIADKDGNIWFTANFAGYIGKFNPKTQEFTEYHMSSTISSPAAPEPHTLLFDQKGVLFFTAQNWNQDGMVGRLIPSTGDIKLVSVPTHLAKTICLAINSKGIPFFCESGHNMLASIDPNTMEVHEYSLPDPRANPRRIGITSDDVIWYSDFARGYLGRFDPKTGKMSEYPSPSGPKSQPYAMTVVNDVIWYVESGTKPNTVVRFDPKTEKFQNWEIPNGGGVVHDMVHAPDGTLWFGCSGINRIARLEVKN